MHVTGFASRQVGSHYLNFDLILTSLLTPRSGPCHLPVACCALFESSPRSVSLIVDDFEILG